MDFEKEAFRDYGIGSQKKDIVLPTKWNKEEQELLIQGMLSIRQAKKGTAIKQLAKIGLAKVLSETKMLEISLENHRKNTRLGIGDLEKTIRQSFVKDEKFNESNTFE